MKNLILTICMIMLVKPASATVLAQDFSYDAAAFEREMEELNKLEKEILNHHFNEHEIFALATLNNTLGGLVLGQSTQGIDQYGFNWGFCYWPIGFFVVALNPNRYREEKFAFFIGAITNIAIITVSVVLFEKWADGKDFLNWM